jgi:hypothetical protein
MLTVPLLEGGVGSWSGVEAVQRLPFVQKSMKQNEEKERLRLLEEKRMAGLIFGRLDLKTGGLSSSYVSGTTSYGFEEYYCDFDSTTQTLTWYNNQTRTSKQDAVNVAKFYCVPIRNTNQQKRFDVHDGMAKVVFSFCTPTDEDFRRWTEAFKDCSVVEEGKLEAHPFYDKNWTVDALKALMVPLKQKIAAHKRKETVEGLTTAAAMLPRVERIEHFVKHAKRLQHELRHGQVGQAADHQLKIKQELEELRKQVSVDVLIPLLGCASACTCNKSSHMLSSRNSCASSCGCSSPHRSKAKSSSMSKRLR